MKHFLLTSLVVVLIAGCGGGGGGGVKSDVSPDEITDTLSAVEKLLYSDSYSGHLVVYFNEVLKLRLNSQRRLYSKSGESAIIGQIQSILDAYPTAKIKRSVSIDEDKLDALKAELEELSGKRLADFNSIYHIEVGDPDTALQVMRALGDIGTVDKVYPGQKVFLDNLASTPDLTSSHQGYLYPESTHGGLNAEAAWNVGVYGQDVQLVAGDSGVNRNHLDLPLSTPGSWANLVCYENDTDPDCQNAVSHGTAVAGILAALDNGHGITGFAPSSIFSIIGGDVSTPLAVIDGNPGDGEAGPGSVLLLNVRIVGPLNPNGVCGTTTYGCLPPPANPEAFDAIEYAVAAGITVVSTAGNGEISLDDPASYYFDQRHLYQEDSGAIIVAASQGANEQIASFSNYGTPVDCFAWGQGVVTTGYDCNAPGKDCEVYSQWYGTTTPTPPNTDPNAYFIDSFGGTSASAPMVAGAAALVQSYAKSVMGQTRYIAPLKMREILVNSGVPQQNGGGYIGMQPRVDIAMGLVDAEWINWTAAYPQLLNNQPLTSTQRQDLNALGVGIICKDNDPAASDPICPEDDLWIPGSGIADTLDFDADGRADLVSWESGLFKLDLSTTGGDVDGFGAWDAMVNYPAINSNIVWPYVEDMNSDGRTDLVLYDKDNGVWYISYTTSAMLSGSGFQGWDHIITTNVQDQLEMDPWDSMYCRPHPGDYDGDGWVDLAVACSDGVWYIETNPNGDPTEPTFVWVPWSSSIDYDWQVNYLTPQQLSEAPGWAYLTATKDIQADNESSDIIIKVPDGLVEEGRIIAKSAPNFTGDLMQGKPHIYGGNDAVMVVAEFTYPGYQVSMGIKTSDSMWLIAEPLPSEYTYLDAPTPNGMFGDLSCHPIAADFDGDGKDDRVVMCPGEWRIAYSGDDYPQFKNNPPNYRYVELAYDLGVFTLPGRSYSGGVSYDTTLRLLDWYQTYYPNDPPPIPVDMVSVSACDLVSATECQ